MYTNIETCWINLIIRFITQRTHYYEFNSYKVNICKFINFKVLIELFTEYVNYFCFSLIDW